MADDDEDLRRPWRERYEAVGRTVVPLWFAVTGIGLGVGGVLRDQPLAGACGAVAGVTVGWLQQQRASVYRRHTIALRRRLKKVRAESEAHAAELEQRISRLQTEVLEQKLMRMLMNPNPEAVAEVTGELPVVAEPEPEPPADAEDEPASEDEATEDEATEDEPADDERQAAQAG